MKQIIALLRQFRRDRVAQNFDLRNLNLARRRPPLPTAAASAASRRSGPAESPLERRD